MLGAVLLRKVASGAGVGGRAVLRAGHRSLSSSRFEQQSLALTASERAFLEENGYAVLRNFMPAKRCEEIEGRMHQIISEFEPESSHSVFRSHRTKADLEDEYFLTSGDKVRFFWEPDAFDSDGKLQFPKHECINKVGHALHTDDPVVGRYVFDDLRQTIQSAGLQDPIPLQCMYILKSSRTGGEVTPHQDSTFLFTNPLSCHGFWLSVHAADRTNGCLWVLPGSHTLPLYQRFVRESQEDGKVVLKLLPYEKEEGAVLPREGGIAVETNVGDLVILHGQLVHWSDKNTSAKSRHSLMVHCVDGACDYPNTNWLQRAEMPRFQERA